MNNHLGISLCLEDVTLGREFFPQTLIVVDLTVEDDPYRTVFIGQGLVSSSQIDDRKPAEAEPDLSGRVEAFIIRSTMANRVRHALQQRRGNLLLPLEFQFSTNAAHIRILFLSGSLKAQPWPNCGLRASVQGIRGRSEESQHLLIQKVGHTPQTQTIREFKDYASSALGGPRDLGDAQFYIIRTLWRDCISRHGQHV